MAPGHSRKVEQIENGVVIKIYRSVTEAGAVVNRSKAAITNACNRGGKSANYHWKFHEEPDDPNEFWIAHPILNIHCSNIGRIRSHRNRIYTPYKNCRGYLVTTIGITTYLIHRLIADAFHENPEDKATVDHMDRDRTNNNFWNLRWATMEEQNNNHGCNLIQNKIIY